MALQEKSAIKARLAELHAEHGEDGIGAWHVPGFGLVAVAAPKNPKDFHKLVNDLKNDKTDSAIALERFAIVCVVEPTDRAEVKEIFRARPAFALKAAAKAQELAGADVEELGKDSEELDPTS